MTNPCRAIDSLFEHLKSCLDSAQLASRPTQPMLRNIAALSFAILAAKEVQLPKVALHIPWERPLTNLVQRLERLLKNPRFQEHQLWAPLAKDILDQAKNATIRLVMDRTDINDRHWFLVVSLVFKGRESVNKSVLFLFDDSLSGFPAPPFFLKGSHQTQDESITRSP